MEYLFLLISWLLARVQNLYRFLIVDAGIPAVVAGVITAIMIALFFYSIYDLFIYREKGKTALIWLIVVLAVPLGSVPYIFIGRKQVRNAPDHKPAEPNEQATVAVNTNPSNTDVNQADNSPGSQTPKKNFLGTTTLLGSIIASIALVAGIIALAFFVFIVIAYIQCINDPKCI